MRTLWQILGDKFQQPQESALLARIRQEAELQFLGADNVLALRSIGTAQKVLEKNPFRNQIVITNDPSNTSEIYIGMTLQTSSTRYFACLEVGESLTIDNYRGEMFALPVTLNDKLAFGEW